MVIFQYNLYIFFLIHLRTVLYPEPCYNEPCYKEVVVYARWLTMIFTDCISPKTPFLVVDNISLEIGTCKCHTVAKLWNIKPLAISVDPRSDAVIAYTFSAMHLSGF